MYYIEIIKCYWLYNIDNSFIIKIHDGKFVKYKDFKQTKENLEVFINKLKTKLVKTKHVDYSFNSKNKSENIVEALKKNKDQYNLIVESLLLPWKI